MNSCLVGNEGFVGDPEAEGRCMVGSREAAIQYMPFKCNDLERGILGPVFEGICDTCELFLKWKILVEGRDL